MGRQVDRRQTLIISITLDHPSHSEELFNSKSTESYSQDATVGQGGLSGSVRGRRPIRMNRDSTSCARVYIGFVGIRYRWEEIDREMKCGRGCGRVGRARMGHGDVADWAKRLVVQPPYETASVVCQVTVSSARSFQFMPNR